MLKNLILLLNGKLIKKIQNSMIAAEKITLIEFPSLLIELSEPYFPKT